MPKLVTPEYVYDPNAAVPTQKDHEVSKAIHQVVQEVRKQLAPTDDTPGELTAQEIITIAFQKVPGAAMVLVAAIRDGFTVLDGESIAHCLVHNLVDEEQY